MNEILNRPIKNDASSVITDHASNSDMQIRYERAQSLVQGIWTKKISLNSTVFPVWIGESDCFYYSRDIRVSSGSVGKEYRLVNAKAATNEMAFDHQALAKALSSTSKQTVDAYNLPFNNLEIKLDASTSIKTVYFDAFDKRWLYEIESTDCREIEILPGNTEVTSPDGKSAIFVRDYNLWVRELNSGDERALTEDGEPDYVYGAVGSAWGEEISAGLQVRWSPDSKRIFTVQRDTRQVKTIPIVHHVPKDGGLRPTVEFRKTAYPGDEHVEELRLLVIEVGSEICKHQPANYRQIPVIRNTHGYFDAKLGWWAKDSRRAYFVDMARDYKQVQVVEFDTHTGATKVLFEEISDTHLSLMHNSDELPALIPLPESDELIWFSERSGWAHLYLYSLETGQLKKSITSGNWLVRNIVSFDSTRRELLVQTAGRVADRDPYYRDLVRINIDSGELVDVIAGDYETIVVAPTELLTSMAGGIGLYHGKVNGISLTGNFVVATRSRADTVPVSLLVDRDGREVLELEIADLSALPEGWQWPEPVKLKAADGHTDIYGLVYRPSDFSADKSYPILSHCFSTPELSWVPKGSFTNDKWVAWPYLDAAALAELGFIVVQIDGSGTPFREKTFFDESYGCVGTVSKLEDHVSGIEQLAARYPYMDLKRVGMIAPFGGPGPLQGLLQFSDICKVAVCNIVHDSRLIPSTLWGDKFDGISGPNSDYQYPEEIIDQLRGKLLLMGGMLDDAVPASIFRLVEALQKNHKDFDLMLLPNLGHWASNYLIRQSWDYLVKHLLEVDPPKEFPLIGAWGME